MGERDLDNQYKIQKLNRRRRQEADPYRQVVDNPAKLVDRPLSRKLRDKQENLTAKKARKKRIPKH